MRVEPCQGATSAFEAMSRADPAGAHRDGMDQTERDGNRESLGTARTQLPRVVGAPLQKRRVWSVDEAAVILGISRAHAYELVARNDLPHVRLGRRILIPVDAVDQLLDVASG